MNFMNRRMFQTGGSVTYADGRTDNISIEDFTQQISALSDADLFALRNSADAGQIVISPELKTILDSVTNRKAIPVTQTIGKPASVSSLSDVGRIAKGLYLPAISGLTRQIFSEEQLENMPAVRSVAEYDSPFYGEGISGFRETADRGGRSAEELSAILQPTVQDFSEDINEISVPQQIEEEVIEPITTIESETLGQTTDPLETDRKRREYEASLVGRDEFGEILPESRLLPEPPPEDQNEIDSLIKEITPIETMVDINKTDAQSKAEDLVKFDPTEIELAKVDTSIDPNIARAPRVPKETTGIFGTDRFLDFVRNVGGQLVATGQMGEGLAGGAAKASEERAARDLLEEQENKKFQRELLIAGIKAGDVDKLTATDFDKINNKEIEMEADIKGFQKSGETLKNLNYIIKTLGEGGATGLQGFFGEATDMIEAAIQRNEGKPFEKLSARTRANALLNVLRQANVREILGESGKTISNLDRQIVEEVFGDIKITTPLAVSVQKLKDSRTRIVGTMTEQKGKIASYENYFKNVGYDSPILANQKSVIDLIKAFTADQATMFMLDPSVDSNQFGVYDITLKG
tara:strand:+ start:407 stop:2143 length:1737 start_codon:yes stop_codon:yes gene_type:complete